MIFKKAEKPNYKKKSIKWGKYHRKRSGEDTPNSQQQISHPIMQPIGKFNILVQKNWQSFLENCELVFGETSDYIKKII